MDQNLLYISRYNKFIQHFKTTKLLEDGYYEKHHILPKCLGGTDDVDNLVLLPARAHFIAHAFLYKAYPKERKLAHAFAMMMVKNSNHKRTTSKLYSMAKLARSNALKGISRPEWVKEKLRKPKSTTENYKKPKSKEHRQNISNGLKGRVFSEDHKKSLTESNRNYQQQRTKMKNEKTEMYRMLFVVSGVSRKQFASLHNENYETMKKYLKGL